MKNIYLSLILCLAIAIISCGSGSSSSTETGYIDPGLTGEKTVNSNKGYTLTGIGESCGPNANCNAIIYQGTLNDVNYVGIAVNDKHDASPDFNLKIYWQASSIPSSVDLAPGNFTIKIIKGTSEYTSTTDNLKLTIADQGDGTYLITFTGNITVGSVSINSGSTIRAYKYP
ncbi:MAG TPA: hypothetical protein PK482_06690 [Spirochaetota bacterium]|nr:hypothetical protein [Spirochaetota bacterium]